MIDYFDFREPADTQMTPELLAEYIGKHKRLVAGRYQKLKAAYMNDYDIYHKARKKKWKPDNRISINFAKYLVDTFSGFFCGIPIKTDSEDENVSKYLELLDQYNDQDNNNSELAKNADIFGVCNEMYYVDEDDEIGITYLTPMESFFIYDDSILKRPLFFVHYYLGADKVERGSWSDENVVQYFYHNGSYRWADEAAEHGFDGVPATAFEENTEMMGLFESVLPMINAYNKAVSEKANDVDYFADAYLKIVGEKLNNEELQSLRDSRIINFYGDGAIDVGFLSKPDGDSTQEHLIERLEKLIFQTAMIANISDENFGTSSGIALRYKLLGMSNLAKVKERKFKSAMNRRYKLIFSNPVAQKNGVNADDWLKVNYHFTMNYPANISDEADVAQKLEGIVSKDTQLKVLSIVDNPAAEKEAIADENREQQEAYLTQVYDESRVLGTKGSGTAKA